MSQRAYPSSFALPVTRTRIVTLAGTVALSAFLVSCTPSRDQPFVQVQLIQAPMQFGPQPTEVAPPQALPLDYDLTDGRYYRPGRARSDADRVRAQRPVPTVRALRVWSNRPIRLDRLEWQAMNAP